MAPAWLRNTLPTLKNNASNRILQRTYSQLFSGAIILIKMNTMPIPKRNMLNSEGAGGPGQAALCLQHPYDNSVEMTH